MRARLLTLTLAALASAAPGRKKEWTRLNRRQLADALATCQEIESNISRASEVFYPLSLGLDFTLAIAHNSQTNYLIPACAFEPATDEDVAVAMRAISANRTPFAIKGGGHQHNSGFSSTEGVLLNMARFSQVSYDAGSGTAQIGAGLVWDGVYSQLDPLGVSVLGGRVSGVGVAGFTLGGGYGYRTNQAGGCTCDTVEAWQLVRPNGEITTVTEASDPDAAFLLRGGFNNIGIVTSFTLRTFPQPNGIWGGTQFYGPDTVDDLLAACADFDQNNQDISASVLCNFVYTAGGLILPNVIAFYDAPEPPSPGPFDRLREIRPFVETWGSTTATGIAQSAPANLTDGAFRVVSNSVFVQGLTPTFMTSLREIMDRYAPELFLRSSLLTAINPEPFVGSAMASQTKDGVFPRQAFKPVELHIMYSNPFEDSNMIALGQEIVDALGAAATAEGQTLGPKYPNYTPANEPLENMYQDLARAQDITRRYDPDAVMTLTGGYKFQ